MSNNIDGLQILIDTAHNIAVLHSCADRLKALTEGLSVEALSLSTNTTRELKEIRQHLIGIANDLQEQQTGESE